MAGVCGCMSAANPPKDVSVPPTGSTRKSNFLTYDEIVAAHADGGNLYVAINRLRPNWMVAHGVAGQGSAGMEFPSVYVDGQEYGSLESLKNLNAYHTGDVTYYDVTKAGARFGIRAGTGGVIDVRTKGAKP
jgi:hypothetical protein